MSSQNKQEWGNSDQELMSDDNNDTQIVYADEDEDDGDDQFLKKCNTRGCDVYTKLRFCSNCYNNYKQRESNEQLRKCNNDHCTNMTRHIKGFCKDCSEEYAKTKYSNYIRNTYGSEPEEIERCRRRGCHRFTSADQNGHKRLFCGSCYRQMKECESSNCHRRTTFEKYCTRCYNERRQ